MAAEIANVRMVRQGTATPWGFRLQGGTDYLAPLIVGKVTPGSVSEKSGLREGDYLREIFDQSADGLTHKNAQEIIMHSGNELRLLVERTSARIWAPSVRSVNVAPGDVTSSPVKYSLEHNNKKVPSQIGAKLARPLDPHHSSQSQAVTVHPQHDTLEIANSNQSASESYRQATGGLFGADPQTEREEPAYLKSATLKLINESEKNGKGSILSQKIQTPGQDQPPINFSKLPACGHCGRYIQGMFCKVADRPLHPECFVCATCGSNLKNKGYYSLGGKLYCDIHAKQLTQNQFKATPPVDPSVFAFRAPPMQLSPNRSEPLKAFYQPEIMKKGDVLHAPKATGLSPSSRGVPTYSPGSGRYPRVPDAEELEFAGYPVQRGASPTHLLTPVQNMQIGVFRHSFLASCKTSAMQSERQEKAPIGRNAQLSNQISAPFVAPKRGKGFLKHSGDMGPRTPACKGCMKEIRGPFVLALDGCWCPDHFVCSVDSCGRKLLDVGFVEFDETGKVCCEFCYEKYFAPACAGCHRPIVTDCLNAVQSHWHPDCFKCVKCLRPIGNGVFFADNGMVFCEDDWNKSFTTKCAKCQFPIETGDRYVEALDHCYHSDCFVCTVCQKSLEGQSFFGKGQSPYCQQHV